MTDVRELLAALFIFVAQFIMLALYLFSPLGGSVTIERIRSKPGTLVSSSFLLIGLDFLYWGILTKFLQPELDNAALIVLTLIAVPTIALTVAQYFAWVLVRSDSWSKEELKHLNRTDASSDFSFQERRRERLKKSPKRNK